ncbi:hypothetical protein [Bythopirellula polymerisocia]|uniref:Uncharacterized protein n=1 Tax=Bythopirellula polymerisocia TaxID=2528003 RepID=A0A5C6CZV9_9BACT|nr:hypothetical protein [Bythopirellula polymerisocia]TWU29988.1 hypothetical protein Pla144_07690 [Bythopirellula polymerisocia]
MATNLCPLATNLYSTMDKVGISFCSTLSAEEVRAKYINPLRSALRLAKAGIYSNHLRQVDPQATTTEHLLVFEVHRFKEGLRILRTELEKVGVPEGLALHNLNPSQPGY